MGAKRAMTVVLLVVPVLTLMTGCDPVYGVTRTAQLKTMPSPALVGDVIKSVQGIESVRYERSEGGRPLTITGIHAPDQVHTFIYKGTNIWACLLLIQDFKGRVEFSQSLTQMHVRPPQKWVDTTRPVMIQVEALMEQRCGLTGLRTSVVERCWGVKRN
jgi:hypothetical protein